MLDQAVGEHIQQVKREARVLEIKALHPGGGERKQGAVGARRHGGGVLAVARENPKLAHDAPRSESHAEVRQHQFAGIDPKHFLRRVATVKERGPRRQVAAHCVRAEDGDVEGGVVGDGGTLEPQDLQQAPRIHRQQAGVQDQHWVEAAQRAVADEQYVAEQRDRT